ncbi:MAG TPA: oxidoreductase [Rhizobiales bacterium]|jgi:dihydroflavonol-4-reductase|nr:oxidoreductase [Hyphomicrobiales bacterium]HCL62981.1 oxidoreductase [Hyphomicrobiales bacterium]
MPNKTAFVTGGTGFIGLNLVEQLTQSGWEVTALHRPNSRLTQLQKYPVRLVEGAIEDPASLDRAMPEDVDAVFHVAGDVSLWSGHKQRQWRTNVEGTRNMVATALAKRARKFVHTSSTAVYGMQTGPFDETSAKLGKNSFNYQNSKTAAEEEVAKGIAQGLDAVLLNPANVIGRYDWGTWSQFIRLAANRQLFRIPPGRACYADVGAVVRAHLAAAEKGRTGHNYILGGNEASYAEIVQMVGKLLGQPTNTVVGRPLVLRGAGRVSEWISMLTGKEPRISQESAALVSASIICRSDKAMRELDYRPASVEAMLKECIDWMIAENLIGPRAVPH